MQGIGLARLKDILAVIISMAITYGIFIFLYSPLYEALSRLNNLGGTEVDISSLLIMLLFIPLFIGLTKVSLNIFRNMQWDVPNRNYKIFPLVLTSILFGLIHSSNPEIEKFGFGTMQIYYISAGLLLGIMTIMDDGLELALGTHAATNFTGAVFVGYDGAAINTDSIMKSHALDAQLMTIAFLVMAVIFLLILKYKYNWGSFRKIFDPINKPNEDEALDRFISNRINETA